MNANQVKKININNLSPYIRFIHRDANTDKKFYVPWRVLYDYEIYFVIDGRMHVRLEDTSFDLQPGDLHIMKPFTWHTRYIPEGEECTYYSIHFDFLYHDDFNPDVEYCAPCDNKVPTVKLNEALSSRTIYEPSEIDLPMKTTMVESEKCHQLIDEMLFNFHEKPVGYQIVLKSNLLKIINLLMVQLSAKSEPFTGSTAFYQKELVMKIRQYLYDNFDKKINFAALSKSYGISPAYLRTLFKKIEGISLIDYLTNMRIERAKSMLLEGKYSVTEISYQVGYSDLQTFSRLFKRKTGFSPLHYVEQYQSVPPTIPAP